MEIADEATDVLNEIQYMDSRVTTLTHHVETIFVTF